MKIVNKQQGFTLVELIIVIVILGILAVTAAPKFLNMSGDATRAVLTSVQSSLETGVRFANNKALIQGVQNNNPTAATGSDAVDGIDVTHGYPDATATGAGAVLDLPDGWVVAYPTTDIAGEMTAVEVTAANITAAELTAATGTDPAFIATADGGIMRIAPTYADLKASGTCYIQYKSATKASASAAVTAPVITSVTTGCD